MMVPAQVLVQSCRYVDLPETIVARVFSRRNADVQLSKLNEKTGSEQLFTAPAQTR